MNYKEILEAYKLVIWDGTSNVRCPGGVFTSDQIREHWNVGPGAEVFYIVKGQNRTVASYYGTDLASGYDSEDVVECGKLMIKDLAESEYRSMLHEGEAFSPCTEEELTRTLVEDQRVSQ